MRRVLATAGRTVFFSSLTVSAALASLLVFPQRFLYSMGLGGALVALFAALISLTVLPAVLTLLGTRVNSLAPRFLQRRAEADTRPDESGFWYRLSRFVMRRPAPVATVSAAAADRDGPPLLQHQVQHRRPDRAADLGQRPPGLRHGQLRVPALPRNADLGRRRRRRAEGGRARSRPRCAGCHGVAEVNPPQRLKGDVTALQVVSSHPFVSEASQTTVKRIRELQPPPGTTTLVGGATADFIDLQTSLVRHLPIVLAIIIVATLVDPLPDDRLGDPADQVAADELPQPQRRLRPAGADLPGRPASRASSTTRSPGAIEQTMPILLFAVAFGLSTDYAVFLLSRIKEARDNGASDSESVAIGLERTGRIVTAAALLFAVAMGAFATSQIIFIKENGVGTALAVLIDASIIRALLVPSLMELLGKWNWWAPKPLRRLHERFGISESAGLREPEPGKA